MLANSLREFGNIPSLSGSLSPLYSEGLWLACVLDLVRFSPLPAHGQCAHLSTESNNNRIWEDEACAQAARLGALVNAGFKTTKIIETNKDPPRKQGGIGGWKI